MNKVVSVDEWQDLTPVYREPFFYNFQVTCIKPNPLPVCWWVSKFCCWDCPRLPGPTEIPLPNVAHSSKWPEAWREGWTRTLWSAFTNSLPYLAGLKLSGSESWISLFTEIKEFCIMYVQSSLITSGGR